MSLHATAEPIPGSMRALAKRLGVTVKVVHEAIKLGRLERSVQQDARGQMKIVDLALAEAEWRANKTRERHRQAGAKPAKITEKSPENGAVASPIARKIPKFHSLGEERRRLIRAQRRKVEVAVARLEGQLIDATAARKEAFEIARTVRDNLLNLPDRLAYEFAAETRAERIHERMEEEVRKALEALAESLQDSAT